MKCPAARDRLVLFVYRELSRSAMGRVGLHLGACEACREAYRDAARVRRLAGGVQLDAAALRRGDTARERLLRAIDREPAAPAALRPWRAGALAAAAALVLAGGVGWSLGRAGRVGNVGAPRPSQGRPVAAVVPDATSPPVPYAQRHIERVLDANAVRGRILELAALSDLDRHGDDWIRELARTGKGIGAYLSSVARGGGAGAETAFALLRRADPRAAGRIACERVQARIASSACVACAVAEGMAVPPGALPAAVEAAPDREEALVSLAAAGARRTDVTAFLREAPRCAASARSARRVAARFPREAAQALCGDRAEGPERVWAALRGAGGSEGDLGPVLAAVWDAEPGRRAWVLGAACDEAPGRLAAWGGAAMPDPALRTAAVEALARAGGPESVGVLMDALRFRETSARASEGLRRITGVDLGTDRSAWVRWQERMKRVRGGGV